ncbi:putative metalloprotease [Streptomyces canus]|uniref:Metalloprotease n=1 Tax=Streptomyces canus TaxID=58343 RepID=A0AAW8FRN5_9ACTN|nr:putative metalloprotease [Streptomyces canus]
MQFDDDARLDTSEVQDVRGSRIPGGRATVGGGVVGLIALVLGLFLGVGPDQLGLTDSGGQPAATASGLAQVEQNCRTGQDANTRDDCRTVAVVNSVQDYWDQEFTRRGAGYSRSPTVFFGERVNTGCGSASSAVGPFYCPDDRKVYLDLGFFDELRSEFGATGGPFAQAYVVAHEYGHHVQDLMGTLSRSQDGRTGAEDPDAPDGPGVRLPGLHGAGRRGQCVELRDVRPGDPRLTHPPVCTWKAARRTALARAGSGWAAARATRTCTVRG